MFVRLTRPVRAKAGWFVALLYLFCVLAPGVALALGDAASCLMTELRRPAPRMFMTVRSRCMRRASRTSMAKNINTTSMPATPRMITPGISTAARLRRSRAAP